MLFSVNQKFVLQLHCIVYVSCILNAVQLTAALSVKCRASGLIAPLKQHTRQHLNIHLMPVDNSCTRQHRSYLFCWLDSSSLSHPFSPDCVDKPSNSCSRRHALLMGAEAEAIAMSFDPNMSELLKLCGCRKTWQLY